MEVTEGLSEHMVKANHYTGENRRPTGPRPPAWPETGRRPCPLKKLLELESQGYVAGGALEPELEHSTPGRYWRVETLCERCEG